MKAYYFQRVSTALSAAYAGPWSRPAGHPDTQVYVHASAATDSRPTDTIISASKGWYDAGDFNKYIVNSGISTYTILAAYEHFPAYYARLNLNIPESNNALPDILDEALWNLRWMLAMQDPGDGGVYHKLTTANFSGAVMPHQATARRYVVQKSTPATLDFAAVMAQASRIFASFTVELPGLADSCLTAALDAWRWARQNPNVRYSQGAMNSVYDPDINTGEYGDGNFADEFQWASAELFITTRADTFLSIRNPLAGAASVPWWGGVNTLGLYSLAFHRTDIAGAVDTSQVVSSILGMANFLKQEVENSTYHVVMGRSNGDFVWGSNGGAGNQGMALIQAYNLTGDTSFLDAALQNLDYLLGRNAVGFCFVTGFGSKPTSKPHHRQSQADGVSAPVPGLVAGGPNPGREDGCSGYIGPERARSYVDDWCSYASNEIAINWNAPLVYLSGAVEALKSPSGLPTPTSVRHDEPGALPGGFGLLQNYPNPFNPATSIGYALPARSAVTLNIYNTTGQLVRTLEQSVDRSAGVHEVSWQGLTDGGQRVASGVYLVRLVAIFGNQAFTDSRKITLVQ
jgi:endoglucanase